MPESYQLTNQRIWEGIPGKALIAPSRLQDVFARIMAAGLPLAVHGLRTDVRLPWSSAPAATVDKPRVVTGQDLITLITERLEGYRGTPRQVWIDPLLIPVAGR